jgi:acetyl-CoA acetyltransferase
VQREWAAKNPRATFKTPITVEDVLNSRIAIYGLEDLGFVPRGEAGGFIIEHKTAPGGKLPLNTNGGGLSYMHSGMYALQVKEIASSGTTC